ncbi:type VI secretion system ImpA family N-terminal domain-containing protein, partial [bacterium]|nr:type VI secretion system ImpA family N-terminal domain-containing protein [bacterium]
MIEDSVIDPVEESDLKTEESVLMSMDNIVLEGDGLDMYAILNNDLSVETLENEIAENEIDEQELIAEVDRIPERIERLLIPLEGDPVGEDPRYGDEFVLIKTEIDKLAFNDYNAVMTLAEEVLTNVGKDIRVAGYFMLANTYINGAKGLIEGLILYRHLLERFGDALYPTKESARNTSMLWLNNSKLVAYVKQNQARIDLETIDLISKQIERLNEDIVAITNDETLCFNSLNSWVKEIRKKVDVPPPPPKALQSEVKTATENDDESGLATENVSADQKTDVSRGEKSSALDLEISSTMSDTELYSLIRKVVNQLMADKEY